MNQGKMRKVSTYSFLNIQNSSQDATYVQISKLDTLQLHNDIKLHDHQVSQPLDEAKIELSNFAKIYRLLSKVLNMSKTCQNGKATQLHARMTIPIIRPSQHPQAPHVMSKPPSHVPTSIYETSHW
jgi:hypothetical protein